jgi:hypothetical protein
LASDPASARHGRALEDAAMQEARNEKDEPVPGLPVRLTAS